MTVPKFVLDRDRAWIKACKLGVHRDHPLWSREYHSFLIAYQLGYVAGVKSTRRTAKPSKRKEPK